MAGRRCRHPASLGITRDFSRLYPTVGMIAVALLTLTPLALRPVRLACLIHAANVHSEPGSNPSKCGHESDRSGPLPSSKGRGFLTGRGGPALARGDPRSIEPAAGFVKTVPIPRPFVQTGWSTDRVPGWSSAGSPQRFFGASQNHSIPLTLRFTSDRIVKERSPPTQPAGACFGGSRHRPALRSTLGGSERFAA